MKTAEPEKKFANHELMTFAIFLLGGEVKPIDLEHIAMKANEIAPGRFSWRKFPEQINIKNVDAFLWDAKKEKNGKLVLNSGKDEWMLTAEGLAFARTRINELKTVDVSRKALSARDKSWQRGERQRMLGSVAYAKFRAGQLDQITDQEAEAFFRLDSYVIGQARELKLLRVKNAFGDDKDIGGVVQALERRISRS